jgi:hypothetical protein
VNSEDLLFYRLWQLAAIAFSVLVLTIGGCVSHQNYRVHRMVESGVDPVKAGCAVGTLSGDRAVCVLTAK